MVTIPLTVRENGYGQPLTNGDNPVNDQILVPSFSTQMQSRLFEAQAPYSRPGSSPNSVCIVVTGTVYPQGMGTFKAIADMHVRTHQLGVVCWLQEIKDPMAGWPYEYLTAMMDHGVTQARNRNFDYIGLVQTDCLPEPDLLIQLMKLELPIVAPIIIDPANNLGVGGPHHELDTGIKPVKWVPMSFLLFRSNVFNCFGHGPIFTGTANEDHIWERFWHYGHRPYLDTTHELKLVTQATRHGNLNIDERWEWFRSVDERRRAPADRSSPNPEDIHTKKGVYAPWLNGQEPTQPPDGV